MKNKNLPEDIVRYVNKKIIKCVASFVLLGAVSVAISFLSWNYFTTETNTVFHISVLMLLCIPPFYVSGFPWKLIDKSWSGTVIDIFVEEETGMNHTSIGRGGPYTKHVIYLKVKKNTGKEKYIAVREFGIRRHKGFPVPNEGDVTKHLHEYSVGDRVYHFYGLNTYYVVKKNSEMIECVICGTQNQKNHIDCFNCGYSLLKNI